MASLASPIVRSIYTERLGQNINLTENIQIKFYFVKILIQFFILKDARKYRDFRLKTTLYGVIY